MYYNLIVDMKNLKAVIRPAVDGVTALEFELGCRMRAQTTSKYLLEMMLEDDVNNDLVPGWDLYTEEEWKHTLTEDQHVGQQMLLVARKEQSTDVENCSPYNIQPIGAYS